MHVYHNMQSNWQSMVAFLGLMPLHNLYKVLMRFQYHASMLEGGLDNKNGSVDALIMWGACMPYDAYVCHSVHSQFGQLIASQRKRLCRSSSK